MKSSFFFVPSLLLGLSIHPLIAAPLKVPDDNTAAFQEVFYQTDAVQSVRLTITEADQRRMMDALPDCVYVPASFRWRNVEFEKVAVRFKGNSSSQPQQKHKRSYLVRFDKYDSELRFLGLRRVSFDNGVQFGSLFSEPIITEILKAEGVKTHRCNYANVYLNGEYRGVYVNVERVDETFLENRFPNASGGLWKNDLGGAGGDLAFVGSDPKRYEKTFEAKNKAGKRREELVSFIKSINTASDEEFATMLESTIDVDQFFRVTSIMLLSGAFDQLTGWNAHNYYLFHDAQRGRWHYLPWDLDVGFCETAFGSLRVLDDWNAAWPVPVGRNNPLLDRVISNPELLNRYRKIATEILVNRFQPQQLCESIDRKYQLIKPHLDADPFPKQRATVQGDLGYGQIVESMKRFMRRRFSTAEQQLAQPGRRPTPVANGQGSPIEFRTRIQQVERNAKGMELKMRQLHQLMPKVNSLLKKGEFVEADKLLNRALELSGGANNADR